MDRLGCCSPGDLPPTLTEYLALPADDSALREALAQEREKCLAVIVEYGMGEDIIATKIRELK